MHLTIVRLNGQKYGLDVDLSKTVRSLKEDLQKIIDVIPERQRLIYCGFELKDDAVLSEFKLQTQTSVHLVLLNEKEYWEGKIKQIDHEKTKKHKEEIKQQEENIKQKEEEIKKQQEELKKQEEKIKQKDEELKQQELEKRPIETDTTRTFLIISEKSPGKALHIEHSDFVKNGSTVHLWDILSKDHKYYTNQLWTIEDNMIFPLKFPSHCFHMNGGNPNGKIHLWERLSEDHKSINNSKWKIVKDKKTGKQNIWSVKFPNQCIHLQGGKIKNGTLIQLFDSDHKNARWRIQYV